MRMHETVRGPARERRASSARRSSGCASNISSPTSSTPTACVACGSEDGAGPTNSSPPRRHRPKPKKDGQADGPKARRGMKPGAAGQWPPTTFSIPRRAERERANTPAPCAASSTASTWDRTGKAVLSLRVSLRRWLDGTRSARGWYDRTVSQDWRRTALATPTVRHGINLKAMRRASLVDGAPGPTQQAAP